jgi:hypothetical protein
MIRAQRVRVKRSPGYSASLADALDVSSYLPALSSGELAVCYTATEGAPGREPGH